jgi:hypothetical protein
LDFQDNVQTVVSWDQAWIAIYVDDQCVHTSSSISKRVKSAYLGSSGCCSGWVFVSIVSEAISTREVLLQKHILEKRTLPWNLEMDGRNG